MVLRQILHEYCPLIHLIPVLCGCFSGYPGKACRGITNKDLTLKLYANGLETSKLAQTVEELHAAIFTVQVDNDQLKREVAKANKREREKKS